MSLPGPVAPVPGAPPRQGAARALPGPGHVIAGKYAIVGVLGEGGMGVVFEATHVKLRQRVAIKMLQPQMLDHPILVTRFEREARAAGQLRNRHTARVMDVDITPEGVPYMVMEYLEGHDLQTELESRSHLPYEEVVDYILQACSAMMEAHHLGIIHRDLKPANLFLAVEGDARDVRIVKVLDFGISKSEGEGDAKLTVAESVMGTAMYMSPEQLRSAGAVDARTDIWSLGIILHELLSGRPPWIGTPTQLAAAIVTEDAPDVRSHAVDANVPAEIAAIVTRALRRDPRERFSDVRELALALAPFAPAHGAGRVLADALLSGASGMFSRVSMQPSVLEVAPTIVQAAAVSQSRTPEGTAPGWSQHHQPAPRNRTVLVGFIAAFAVGLLVVAGLALAWLRWRAPLGDERATASAVAPSASATVSISDPLPPVIDPAPPVTGQGVAAAPPESATTPRPRPPAGTGGKAAAGRPVPRAPAAPATTTARPTPPATAKPPATPAAPAGPAANPLLL